MTRRDFDTGRGSAVFFSGPNLTKKQLKRRAIPALSNSD
jgi:hypothetical protein